MVDGDGVYRNDRPGARLLQRRRGHRGHQEPAASSAGDVIVLIVPRSAWAPAWKRSTRSPRRSSIWRFGKHVAVITDARFSGVSTGACIGHVAPEALAGGPLGKVRDGDLIEIVIDRVNLEGSVNLVVDGDAAEGARVLDARPLRDDLAPDAALPRGVTLVGDAPGRKRRHLGRLRFRRGRDRRQVEVRWGLRRGSVLGPLAFS